MSWDSKNAPHLATSIWSASSTKNTACGLPIFTHTAVPNGISSKLTSSVSCALASGISCQSSRAGPIFTDIRPVSFIHADSLPEIVSISTLSFAVSCINSHATHLVPLPQAPATDPSALTISSQISAPDELADNSII